MKLTIFFKEKLLNCFKIIFLLIFVVCNCFNDASAQQNQTNVLDETLTDAYTIMGTTLGGAILGLSTLSFVEEPGDHLKNIVVGGAIGIILGVGIVAYSQASKSKDLYFQSGKPQGYNDPNFNTYSRKIWHVTQSSQFLEKKKSLNELPAFVKSWSF